MASSLPSLDIVLENAIAKNRIVGASICVVHNGNLIYTAAAGMADRVSNRPAQPDTIYRMASLTKLVVVCTILALVDAGEFALEDPISKHLPYFTPALPDGSRPKITIAQLLSHTSGVGSNREPGVQELQEARFQAVNGNFWHLSLEDNMKRLANHHLLYVPGESWEYSMSIDLLGALAATKTGGTLLDAIQKYVTGPLAMNDTLFSVADHIRLATAYGVQHDGPQPMLDPQIVVNDWQGETTFYPDHIFDRKAYQFGGGGMAGTAVDFIKLLAALSGDGAPIISQNLVAQGQRDRTKSSDREPVFGGYGFGFFGEIIGNNTSRTTPLSTGSYGWGGHFGNSWFVDPNRQLAVVALTNTALEGFCGRFPFDVRDAIYADLF